MYLNSKFIDQKYGSHVREKRKFSEKMLQNPSQNNGCILTRNGDLKAELMQLIKRSEMNGQREGSITGLDIMPLKNLVLMSQLTTMLTLTNSTISIQNFI